MIRRLSTSATLLQRSVRRAVAALERVAGKFAAAAGISNGMGVVDEDDSKGDEEEGFHIFY